MIAVLAADTLVRNLALVPMATMLFPTVECPATGLSVTVPVKVPVFITLQSIL